MTETKVILTKGLPGSGKSTWAKKLIKDNPGKYKRISKDDLRLMLDDGKWSKQNEKFIIDARDALIDATIDAGYIAIVDDTNLASVHFEHIKQLIRPYAVEVKDFTDVSVETCIKRDQRRANYVGEKVIRDMYNKYLKPASESPEYNNSLQDAVICDIDGTLALAGDRNPYDRDFINDTPHKAVVDLVKSIIDNEIVIFVSGRKDSYKDETLEWLKQHVGYQPNSDRLFMRRFPDEDGISDVIVKKRIYEENIKDKYNIKYVLDDRNRVVEYWRSIGLPTFQVAEGNF
jgi:predicted kinase